MSRSGSPADPDFPCFPDDSAIFSVDALERRDFEGSADWEKGVVGDWRAAASASLEPLEKVVARVGSPLLVVPSGNV